MLQKLSVRPDNIYTTKLVDLIMPETVPGEMLDWVILVMEYLPSDLRKALVNEQMSHLTEEHITVILFNMLSAIEFIHTAGLVHRDLKPANILIDSGCQIKLCDFGSTRPILPNKVSTEFASPQRVSKLQLRCISPVEVKQLPDVNVTLQSLKLNTMQGRSSVSRNN